MATPLSAPCQADCLALGQVQTQQGLICAYLRPPQYERKACISSTKTSPGILQAMSVWSVGHHAWSAQAARSRKKHLGFRESVPGQESRVLPITERGIKRLGCVPDRAAERTRACCLCRHHAISLPFLLVQSYIILTAIRPIRIPHIRWQPYGNRGLRAGLRRLV